MTVSDAPPLGALLEEYDRALDHTDMLHADLSEREIRWRPDERSSSIGWHLGHQPAVAHFMLRNLTAAEPRLDAELEVLVDSATPESARGEIPDVERILAYRAAVADRVRGRVRLIAAGDVSAAAQMRVVVAPLLVALINHEYQHDVWIGEVRSEAHGRPLPPTPTSDLLGLVDGYPVLVTTR